MVLSEVAAVTASDWVKGIALSVAASIIGGASKLAIRKSWLLEHQEEEERMRFSHHSRRRVSLSRGAMEPVALSDSDGDDGYVDTTSHVAALGRGGEAKTRHHLLTDETDPMDHFEDDHLEDGESIVNADYHHEAPLLRSCSPSSWLAYGLRLSGMLGMSVLNPICCVFAMNYASPSILAPFSGLTLVWIVLFSFPLIGEQPAPRQVLAAALIVLGEVIVAIFGDHTNDEDLTVEDVRQSYLNWQFLTYIGFVTVWFFFLGYQIFYSHSPKIRRFAWGTAGGTLSGFQNFLKDALTILKAANNKSTSDTIPVGLFVCLISLAVFAAFGGLLVLTACMKRYNATYSAAMFVGSFVVSASIMSAIHYNTLSHLDDASNMVMYPTGLAILMSGVWILSTEKHAEDEVRTSPPVSRRNSESSVAVAARSDANGSGMPAGNDDSYDDIM